MQSYQQIDAEFAQYEAEAAALKQRMDALKERRQSLRQQECDQALPEIVERMTTLGITLEQVRAALAVAKPAATVIHKYWNPETKETHSGKGTLPGWLGGKTGKGRTGDPRYLNPAWVAKQDANDAQKNAAKGAKKNKTKSRGATGAVAAPASSGAATVSNDAPTTTDGVERPASNDSAPIVVANAAVADATRVESNAVSAPIVSNLN